MSITVTGTGIATGPSDEAVVSFELLARRPRAAEALDDLARLVTEVFAVVAGSAATSHATSQLSLRVDHDREGNPRGQVAAQVLDVTTPISEVGSVLTAVVTAGGDGVAVRSLQQHASDQAALRTRARSAAVADARERASQHADLVGRQLGELLELEERDATAGGPRPLMMRAMAAESMPVAAASDDVTVTVVTRWALV